jgi:hypothetical protein
MSIGGNANYTHIQSHGTPSAFEPGWISQAGSVGPPGVPESSPYKVIDVVVDISDGNPLDFFILGDPIPLNCVVLSYSVIGEIVAGSTGAMESKYTIGFSQFNTINGVIVATGTPVDGVGLGQSTDAGAINVGAVQTTPHTFNTADPNLPVVYINSPVTAGGNRDQGSMRVKLVILCP